MARRRSSSRKSSSSAKSSPSSSSSSSSSKSTPAARPSTRTASTPGGQSLQNFAAKRAAERQGTSFNPSTQKAVTTRLPIVDQDYNQDYNPESNSPSSVLDDADLSSVLSRAERSISNNPAASQQLAQVTDALKYIEGLNPEDKTSLLRSLEDLASGTIDPYYQRKFLELEQGYNIDEDERNGLFAQGKRDRSLDQGRLYGLRLDNLARRGIFNPSSTLNSGLLSPDDFTEEFINEEADQSFLDGIKKRSTDLGYNNSVQNVRDLQETYKLIETDERLKNINALVNQYHKRNPDNNIDIGLSDYRGNSGLPGYTNVPTSRAGTGIRSQSVPEAFTQPRFSNPGELRKTPAPSTVQNGKRVVNLKNRTWKYLK